MPPAIKVYFPPDPEKKYPENFRDTTRYFVQKIAIDNNLAPEQNASMTRKELEDCNRKFVETSIKALEKDDKYSNYI